jgi:extracellular elastinolytic metalloproteinase
MKVSSHRLTLLLVAVIALLTSNARAQIDSAFAPDEPRTHAGSAAGPLTGPSSAAPGAVVAEFLRGQGRNVDVRSLVAGVRSAAGNGVSTVRIEQRIGGLRLYGASAKASLSARGELLHLVENLVAGGDRAVGRTRVSEGEALAAALRYLYPDDAIATGPGRREGDTVRFARTAFFHDDPTVTRVVYPAADGSLGAGFLVHTWTDVGNLLHETLIGAGGEVLFDEFRTNQDRYNVFEISPKVSTQTVVDGPAPSPTAPSPQGWLFAGNQNSINIAGNNANAYLDAVANNAADSGGTTVTSGEFLTDVNLTQSPSTASNREVAVQNLFYLNNVVHDRLYEQGFTEAAGNFQESNFGQGGAGSDSVLAEAQDGSGTDNANFATPTDGGNPRMQMFLWNGGPDHVVHVNSPGSADYPALPAAFGPALTTTGLTGAVVAVGEACSAVPNIAGKLALIDRGTCEFVTKVFNAQTAGAIAAIVANNNTSDPDEVFVMGGSSKKIKIPSVMISFSNGSNLKALSSPNATVRKLATAPPQRDADLDADVVFHEYGHGLTWRMIGGMSGRLAGAIGEGASDVLAMLLTGDDAIGEYSAVNTNGIRRYRYGQYPADMTYSDVTGSEVHADGEIYAAIMWELIQLFEANGKTSNDVFAYFVDGMNFTPSTPAFEDMRDGMLQAASGSQADQCLIWDAFAARGVGVGANGGVVGRRVVVTESFTKPASCP